MTSPLVSALSARWTLSTSLRSASSAGDAASCIGIGWSATVSFPVANRRLQTTIGMPNAWRAPRHLLADAAVAEQAERPAEQAARLRILLLVPPCRRAARRRCRRRADRARASARMRARRRRSRSCPDSSTRRSRASTRSRRRSCCSPRRRGRRARARPPRASAAVTAVLRTTRTSAPFSRIAVVSASSFRSGWYNTSQPAAFSPSMPLCSNLSATRTSHMT